MVLSPNNPDAVVVHREFRTTQFEFCRHGFVVVARESRHPLTEKEYCLYSAGEKEEREEPVARLPQQSHLNLFGFPSVSHSDSKEPDVSPAWDGNLLSPTPACVQFCKMTNGM